VTELLRIETEHPVLLPYTQPIVELYFSDHPSNCGALASELLDVHRSAVGGWFDYAHFFSVGPDRSLRAVLEGGFGKLAEGPQVLAERYAEVLRRAGVSVSLLPSRRPVWWDGEQWVEETGALYALILGESYVVAQSVSAERVA
jgi:hypothetical protein